MAYAVSGTAICIIFKSLFSLKNVLDLIHERLMKNYFIFLFAFFFFFPFKVSDIKQRRKWTRLLKFDKIYNWFFIAAHLIEM